MQAQHMMMEFGQYMSGSEEDKMRKGRKFMDDIEEMKEDWGMDGANSLAMAGAAMVVAISALSFWVSNLRNVLN